MTSEELRAYYDIPENAQAMCRMLMAAHPGWTVWRLGAHCTLRGVPVWCARRESWPVNCRPLVNENAGTVNEAMFTMDRGVLAP